MKTTNDLTEGNVAKTLLKFAVPFFIAAAMQSLYGAVDMFTVGHFSGTHAISAVNMGSQIMYVITCLVIGMSQGVTVELGQFLGAKSREGIRNVLRVTLVLFVAMGVVMTPIMVIIPEWLVEILRTPEPAKVGTAAYIRICSAAIPFIILFNVTAAIYRGLGDSKTPMYIVAIACVVNIGLDFLLTGALKMDVMGVAIATAAAQAVSSVVAAAILLGRLKQFRKTEGEEEEASHKNTSCRSILGFIFLVGFPAALQDTLMNLAFVLITVIANGRGLAASSAVGVVEKIMIILFLVPGALLAANAAITAQNVGARKIDRAVESLKVSLVFSGIIGAFACALCWIVPNALCSIFTEDPEVLELSRQYLVSYAPDAFLAAFTFSLNGFLCGMEKSIIVFIHNTIAIFGFRVPIAYFMSKAHPESMTPMGWSSPTGSLVSIIIMAVYFIAAKPLDKLRQAAYPQGED